MSEFDFLYQEPSDGSADFQPDGVRGQDRHTDGQRSRLFFPGRVPNQPHYTNDDARFLCPTVGTPLHPHLYSRDRIFSFRHYPEDYHIPQPLQPLSPLADGYPVEPTRAITAATNVVPTSVSIATAGIFAPLVQVKREKLEPPPPQVEARPSSPSEMNMTRLGYHAQKQADVIPGRVRRQLLYRPQCSVCLKTFSRLGNLTVHMRIHSGEKPFQCQYCPKRFAQSGNHIAHERLHTGDKPFQCRFCPKAFAQSGNLAAHERVHTGKKPYECEYCGKRFTQSSARKNHFVTHFN